ncbi:M48 family metalloprotease [Actinoplanes subglobosus]|uniref:M48 family metalloprotease n=1 Tax=Actinoplanes subglobosus TaxID=1547892 RepID=A0ABV8IZE1_9ACTN
MTGLTPSRGHYLLLLAVLVLSGAYAGSLMFDNLTARTWAWQEQACAAEQQRRFGPPADDYEAIEQELWEIRCMEPLERSKSLTAAGSALMVLSGGYGLMVLLPRVDRWRRGRLRPPSPGWPAAGARAATATGLRQIPAVALGPPGLTEAYAVRYQGAPCIVLPAGARRLDTGRLDAVLRHESAHIAAGDIGLVWLTRGLYWALPCVALLPLVWPLARWSAGVPPGDFDAGAWLDFSIRVVVLAVVGFTLSRKISRVREHEADLRAAGSGTGEGLTRLLQPGAAPDGPSRSWWARLTSPHPSPSRRLAVLHRPGLLLRFDLIDDLAAGLLAATVQMTVSEHVTNAFNGGELGQYATAFGAIAAGVLLAATWGLTMWRRAVTDPGASAWHSLYGPSLAVALGTPAGLLLGLGNITAGGPYGHWSVMVTLPLMLAAAGAISLRLARAWARQGGVRPITPLLVNSLLFGAAGWIGSTLGIFTAGYYTPRRYLLVLGLMPWGYGAMAAVLGTALLAWWWRIPGRRVTVIAVLAAVAVTWPLRSLIAVPAGAVPMRLDIWAAAAAGVGFAAVMLALPGAGLVAALRGAPIVTFLLAAGWWAAHGPPYPLPGPFLRTAMAMFASGLFLFGVPLLFLPHNPIRGRPPAWSPVVAAAAAPAALAATVLLAAGAMAYDFDVTF